MGKVPKKARKKKVQTAAIQIYDSESDTSINYGKCDIAGCTSTAKNFYCLNNAKCGNKVHHFPCGQDNNLYCYQEFEDVKKVFSFCSDSYKNNFDKSGQSYP